MIQYRHMQILHLSLNINTYGQVKGIKLADVIRNVIFCGNRCQSYICAIMLFVEIMNHNIVRMLVIGNNETVL